MTTDNMWNSLRNVGGGSGARGWSARETVMQPMDDNGNWELVQTRGGGCLAGGWGQEENKEELGVSSGGVEED